MKEHLIDLNFINYMLLLFTLIFNKYTLNYSIENEQINFYEKTINYNSFINLRSLIMFQFKTLRDLTVINYLGLLKDLELYYIFLSYKLSMKCALKNFINKEDLVISLIDIFINSNWLERESWDLYGIKYIYHSDLRRILTDYGFIGHPLLKVFPLTGFVEMRYDDLLNKIIKEKVEFTQAFRFFYFINPWFTKYEKNI
jgi:NADH-quinone oxidoreductase subunit C